MLKKIDMKQTILDTTSGWIKETHQTSRKNVLLDSIYLQDEKFQMAVSIINVLERKYAPDLAAKIYTNGTSLLAREGVIKIQEKPQLGFHILNFSAFNLP